MQDREASAADVAIIIPTYNRPEILRACLDSLSRLEGGPFPTIVVDDGSDEPLDAICAAAGPWVRLVRQENAGPAAARNAGANAAEGASFLLFTDDDCRPRPDWARRMLAAQGGTADLLVGGAVANALTHNVYSAASQALCSYLYAFYHANGSEMTFFTTNNMCVRREDFLRIGGFDQSFSVASEDRDFSLRWKSAGGRLAYAAEAVVDHAHELTLRQFWRQHSNYGRGARRLHLAMDGRGDRRPKLESARFYAGMLFYPLRHGGRSGPVQSVLVGLSQVAMVAGYAAAIREARGRDRQSP